MILVFNTYITDEPLNSIHGNGSEWQKIRESNTTFRRRSKLDIFKYTLDSYQYIPFDESYFWVECEDPSLHDEINEYILSRFPRAFISNKRCLTHKEYQGMLSTINNDNWIFFSPNNDHVYWRSDKIISDLDYLLEYADTIAEEHNGMVGIFYSHLEEFRNLPFPQTWFGQRWNNSSQPRKLIYQNGRLVCFSSSLGENTSVQILHKNLFKRFFSYDFGNIPIRRIEDLRPLFTVRDQISIVPRFDFCSHFDGQPSLNPFVLPPLFIPDGYFDNKMSFLEDAPIYEIGCVNLSTRFKLPPYLDPYCGADFIGDYWSLPIFIRAKHEMEF